MVKKLIKRRTFLKIVSSSLLMSSIASCTHKKFFNPDEDILLSGGSYTEGNATHYALIAINLTSQGKRVVKTAFMPHDILINPNNKYRIYCFEKNGTNACEVDLQKKAVIRNFHSTPNRNFSGHAAFSEDGERLYCVENTLNSNGSKRFGNIIIRETRTLSIIKQLSIYGLSAHDCQLIDSQTLVVSYTGQAGSDQQPSSLVYISLETEKIIKRIQANDNDMHHNLNNGHFEISKENDLVIASAPLINQKDTRLAKQSGGVSIKSNNEQLVTIRKPKVVINRMIGEALSIEISLQNKTVAVTHPDANLITFWSIDKKQIIKAFGIENPRGISQTINGKNFIVSYGNKAAMAQISAGDLTPIAQSIVQPTHASGEHIINWSKTLRKIMPKTFY